jgi:hypothetical protein
LRDPALIFQTIESVQEYGSVCPNRKCHKLPLEQTPIEQDMHQHQTGGERRKQGKKVQISDEEKRGLFLQVPDTSPLFPVALRYGKCAILLQAETCDGAQNRKRNYK